MESIDLQYFDKRLPQYIECCNGIADELNVVRSLWIELSNFIFIRYDHFARKNIKNEKPTIVQKKTEKKSLREQ